MVRLMHWYVKPHNTKANQVDLYTSFNTSQCRAIARLTEQTNGSVKNGLRSVSKEVYLLAVLQVTSSHQ